MDHLRLPKDPHHIVKRPRHAAKRGGRHYSPDRAVVPLTSLW